MEFRKAWNLSKDFQFVKTNRVKRNKCSNTTEDVGRYVNKIMRANALGGAQYKQARREASAYIKMCNQVGGHFTFWNSWTKSNMYFFVERLVRSSSVQEWEETMESSDMVNQ